MIDFSKAYVGMQVVLKSHGTQHTITHKSSNVKPEPEFLLSDLEAPYYPEELDYADPEPVELKVGDAVEVITFNEYQDGRCGVIDKIEADNCSPYCVKFNDGGSLCFQRHSLRKITAPPSAPRAKRVEVEWETVRVPTTVTIQFTPTEALLIAGIVGGFTDVQWVCDEIKAALAEREETK